MHRRHGDNSGKQTERSGGEKEEESPGNHRYTGPLPRLAGCWSLVSLTSHLLSSSRDQVRGGNSEGRVLGAEPWALTVPAVEGNGSLGRKGRTGCTRDNLPGRDTPLAPPAVCLALHDQGHHFQRHPGNSSVSPREHRLQVEPETD